MNPDKRRESLSQIDLFSSLTAQERDKLLEKVTPISIREGETLFKEGEAAQGMFILLRGMISIFKDDRFITQIRDPDYLGEMALIESSPRSASAIAASDAELLALDCATFQEIVARNPGALCSIMQSLSARVRADTKKLAQEFQKANILIHDMRNRLGSLLLLDLIESDALSSTDQHYLKLMKSSYHDLADMMEEALANAKHQRFAPVFSWSSINPLIEELNSSLFTLHPALSNKKIVLELGPEMPNIYICEPEIRRVLSNLVINAGEASAAHKPITISTLKEEEYLLIMVKDHGPGIAKDIQRMVFKANFTTKKGGNGLGLSSCREIVEKRHGGRLRFTSGKKGTVFMVHLPITPEGGREKFP